jgi:hypothetical protein
MIPQRRLFAVRLVGGHGARCSGSLVMLLLLLLFWFYFKVNAEVVGTVPGAYSIFL